MREHKYKIWDKESNKFLIEDSSTDIRIDPFTGNIVAYYFYTYFTGLPKYFLDRYELFQYIGLKDKNKVEICEGDIAKVNSGFKGRTHIGQIIFEDGAFVLSDFWMTHLDNPSDFREELNNIEVIGNIKLNADLLNHKEVD